MDMRQAGSDDKGPYKGLENEIENAQSNHLSPLSRAVALPVLKRRENRKMGEERGLKNSGWGGEDGKGRRSARSAFFFPDQSRSLILAHRTFSRFIPFSYLLSSVRIFDCRRSLSGGERVPLLMLSLIVEAQCLTLNIKGLWN